MNEVMVGDNLADIVDEKARIDQMNAEALAQIEAAQADPTQQNYFIRHDKLRPIKSEREYVQCLMKGVKVTVVNYDKAMEYEAAFRKGRAKRKKARKTAAASRKVNR